MREFIGGLLAITSLIGIILCLVALIRPMPKLFMPSRGRAGLGLLSMFVMMIVAGMILPTPPADATKAPEAKTVTKTAAPAAPKIDIKAEVDANWQEVLNALGPCDRASKSVAKASEGPTDP